MKRNTGKRTSEMGLRVITFSPSARIPGISVPRTPRQWGEPDRLVHLPQNGVVTDILMTDSGRVICQKYGTKLQKAAVPLKGTAATIAEVMKKLHVELHGKLVAYDELVASIPEVSEEAKEIGENVIETCQSELTLAIWEGTEYTGQDGLTVDLAGANFTLKQYDTVLIENLDGQKYDVICRLAQELHDLKKQVADGETKMGKMDGEIAVLNLKLDLERGKLLKAFKADQRAVFDQIETGQMTMSFNNAGEIEFWTTGRIEETAESLTENQQTLVTCILRENEMLDSITPEMAAVIGFEASETESVGDQIETEANADQTETPGEEPVETEADADQTETSASSSEELVTAETGGESKETTE